MTGNWAKPCGGGSTAAATIAYGCATGPDGLDLARTQPFDAIVMDVAIPGRGGIDVLRELRARDVQTPVLLLAALGSVMERVAGLNAGADNYLVKPVEFVELKARVAAVCRRAIQRPAPYLRAGSLCLDLSTRRAVAGPSEQDVELTPTEFRLLELLMRHTGQVVTRPMMCEQVWPAEGEGTRNAVNVYSIACAASSAAAAAMRGFKPFEDKAIS